MCSTPPPFSDPFQNVRRFSFVLTQTSPTLNKLQNIYKYQVSFIRSTIKNSFIVYLFGITDLTYFWSRWSTYEHFFVWIIQNVSKHTWTIQSVSKHTWIIRVLPQSLGVFFTRKFRFTEHQSLCVSLTDSEGWQLGLCCTNRFRLADERESLRAHANLCGRNAMFLLKWRKLVIRWQVTSESDTSD